MKYSYTCRLVSKNFEASKRIITHLHHGDERLLSIGQFCFTTNTEQLLVMDHPIKSLDNALDSRKGPLRRDETIDGEGIDGGISVHHEEIFIECGVDTDDIFNLMIHFELQWVHRRVEMDLSYDQLWAINMEGNERRTLFKKCMTTICESRLPRFPGRDLSEGFPTLTTTMYGTTCPEHS